MDSTCWLFHTGSKSRFAKRVPSRFRTSLRPMKWSTRNTWFSGTSVPTRSLSSRAPARSVPNGFSIASTVPSGRSTSRSAWQARAVMAGGSAKKRAGVPSHSASSDLSSSTAVTSHRR